MWARALVEDQSLVVSWVRVLRRGSVVGRVVGQGFASWVSRGSGFCVVGQSWAGSNFRASPLKSNSGASPLLRA